DDAALLHQYALKRFARVIPAQRGYTRARVRVGRHAMGLRVVQHLDAVLDVAEEFISAVQRVAIGGVDHARFCQRVERLERTRRTQAFVASAEDQLLGLREQFDVANTAAAEFDIENWIAELGAFVSRKNLPLDRFDVGDGGEVEMLAPDKGL